MQIPGWHTTQYVAKPFIQSNVPSAVTAITNRVLTQFNTFQLVCGVYYIVLYCFHMMHYVSNG